ncbi:hypothetical protein C4D60_Mb05t26070 [Musa balbisiana]|uniref:Uncharacterized protein n=1 Tax=Musa balbisiana TaxID=52838 RepID=A0A4S8JYX5_MUSBA|nr:hypothetical protein C4D60_Mb05t26070 [Musa balbisiana]
MGTQTTGAKKEVVVTDQEKMGGEQIAGEPQTLLASRSSVDELMESKGGKKKSSSSSSSLQYEAPLGYSIEDIRPHGGIKKFQSAAYSNCVRKPS